MPDPGEGTKGRRALTPTVSRPTPSHAMLACAQPRQGRHIVPHHPTTVRVTPPARPAAPDATVDAVSHPTPPHGHAALPAAPTVTSAPHPCPRRCSTRSAWWPPHRGRRRRAGQGGAGAGRRPRGTLPAGSPRRAGAAAGRRGPVPASGASSPSWRPSASGERSSTPHRGPGPGAGAGGPCPGPRPPAPAPAPAPGLPGGAGAREAAPHPAPPRPIGRKGRGRA